MKFHKYSVLVANHQVTSVLTLHSEPVVKFGDTIDITGDILGNAQDIKIKVNGRQPRITELDINITGDTGLTHTRLLTFNVIELGTGPWQVLEDETLDKETGLPYPTPALNFQDKQIAPREEAPVGTVYAFVNKVTGEIVGRRSWSTVPRLFGRKCDATQSNQNTSSNELLKFNLVPAE